jgi:hypothetical protein
MTEQSQSQSQSQDLDTIAVTDTDEVFGEAEEMSAEEQAELEASLAQFQAYLLEMLAAQQAQSVFGSTEINDFKPIDNTLESDDFNRGAQYAVAGAENVQQVFIKVLVEFLTKLEEEAPVDDEGKPSDDDIQRFNYAMGALDILQVLNGRLDARENPTLTFVQDGYVAYRAEEAGVSPEDGLNLQELQALVIAKGAETTEAPAETDKDA